MGPGFRRDASAFSSNDLALPEAFDLRWAVAELGENLVIVRAEFGGHVDLSSDRGPWTREALEASALETLEAMRERPSLAQE